MPTLEIAQKIRFGKSRRILQCPAPIFTLGITPESDSVTSVKPGEGKSNFTNIVWAFARAIRRC